MIRKRILAVLFLATIAASAGGAHATPGDKEADRCDSWYRDGDAPDGTSYDDDNDGVTMDNGPATSVGDPAHTQVVNEGGHYVVRNDVTYVEVVGGQDYRRPLGDTANGARGGYVQGEAEVEGHNVDWHASFFLGSDGSSTGKLEKNGCVKADGTKVDQMQCSNPPEAGKGNLCT